MVASFPITVPLIAFLAMLLVLFIQTRWLYRHTTDPWFKAVSLGMLGGLGGLAMANMFGSRIYAHEEISGYFWILAALVMRAMRW